MKLEEQTEIQSGKDCAKDEKKVGGAAARVGLAVEGGEEKESGSSSAGDGDGTGGDRNDEDGMRRNQSRTGPLVTDDASGK